MTTTIHLKPLKLWQSLFFFLIPGIYGLIAMEFIFPFLVNLGMKEEGAFNAVYLSVFLGLLLITWIALKVEGWDFHWEPIKERLRIKKMDAAAWKVTLVFMFVYLLLGLAFNILSQFIYGRVNFLIPYADIPLTNIPLYLFIFLINIISEEVLWRGYILPRQELTHGKYAWIVNGVLWSLFHISKWWAIPFMVLRQWMIPFVAQRTRNTTPALVIHFVSNGISVLLSIIPILTA